MRPISGNVFGHAGLLRRLETLGTGPSSDTRAAKLTILANRLTLSYMLITLPFSFLIMRMGMKLLAWAVLPNLALHILTLVLNAKGWTKPARLNLALTASASIAFFAIALGRGSGAQLLLLAATLNYLILFDWEKERILVLAGLALNSALFLGYQSLSFRMGTLYALAPEAERPIRIAVSLAAVVGIIAGLLHFVIENARVEKDLVAAKDKAQEADRLKGRFISNMSHEIRTPLNVILGLAQIMEYPDSQSRRKEFLADIRSSANDLLALLNDVLDLSKLEAGKMKLETVPFRIRDLAETALAPFRSQAAQMGLGLRLDADAGAAGLLRGDPVKLRQVLNNLLSNALKFTSEGNVTLRIRSDAGEGGRLRIRFEVSDTGVGIAEDAQRRLFQPFRQADDSITRTFGGSGLGLIICKGLVELMGGTIDLHSRLGAGTKVGFTVPFDLAEEAHPHATGTDAASAPAPSPRSAGAKAGKARILIVEDQPSNRMVLRSLLEVRGFRADEAVDGKQALEAAMAGPYDLILMDCHMPVMDGIECTRRIRALGGPRPVIVGITADAMTETRRHCLEAGMDQVLLKPLDEKELGKVLLPWKADAQGGTPVVPEPETSEWVDVARLGRLMRETRLRDPEHRKKAFRQFEADVQALRRGLKEAVRTSEGQQLKDAAHGLKGLCLTLGLERLADVCKRLETASLAGGSSDWSPVLDDLETIFEVSLADLRRVLEIA